MNDQIKLLIAQEIQKMVNYYEDKIRQLSVYKPNLEEVNVNDMKSLIESQEKEIKALQLEVLIYKQRSLKNSSTCTSDQSSVQLENENLLKMNQHLQEVSNIRLRHINMLRQLLAENQIEYNDQHENEAAIKALSMINSKLDQELYKDV